MANTGVSNYHLEYINVASQHWDPESENFAGGDHLITAITNGWEIQQCVRRMHWYAGMRGITINHFEFVRGEEAMNMPVINNPYVERFIRFQGIEVIDETMETASDSEDTSVA